MTQARSLRSAGLRVSATLAFVFASLVSGCEPACAEPRAFVVYAQTVGAVPIDDATLACANAAGVGVESVPLGRGEYTCGSAGGTYDLIVAWRGQIYSAPGLLVGSGGTRCGGPRTREIAIVFTDP